MKRLHIHVGVENIEESVRFYSALFGTAPVKTKGDYAKWLLDDPHVNFAVSTRANTRGIDHLGIQVDDDAELTALRGRIEAANLPVSDEGETVCCYAKSDKSWVRDPAGIPWEAYRTMEDAEMYSGTSATAARPRKKPLAAAAEGDCPMDALSQGLRFLRLWEFQSCSRPAQLVIELTG